MLTLLLSGGQTGADRAALDVAIRHDFPHSGWCPAGRRAEDGRIGGQYMLMETPSTKYLQRTKWNVRDSDGTVVFTLDAEANGGSLRTIEFARQYSKPCLHLSPGKTYQPALDLQRFVARHGIERLNVAGSRESRCPGTYRWAVQIIDDAFFWSENHPNMLGGPGEG